MYVFSAEPYLLSPSYLSGLLAWDVVWLCQTNWDIAASVWLLLQVGLTFCKSVFNSINIPETPTIHFHTSAM